MAKNSITGSVIAPLYFGPGLDQAPGNIVSGNLSTSDGSEVINVPRVANATNNSIITNVDGNANTLTCESNLKFDGAELSIVGDVSGSGQAQFGSLQIAGGLKLNRRNITSTITASVTDYYIGTDTSSNILSIRLPDAANLLNGQTYVVKDEAGTADTNNVTILASGSQTIDGQNSVILESPFASIQLYCDGTNKYFIY